MENSISVNTHLVDVVFTVTTKQFAILTLSIGLGITIAGLVMLSKQGF